MKTTGPNKVIIKIDSQEQQQQDIPRSSRGIAHKVLQEVANKENIIGRPRMTKTSDATHDKHIKCVNKAVQTGEATITAEDLTSPDEPSADYWRLLAEKRGEALNDSFQENERLKEQIESLVDENKICKEMLDESKHLVDVLQELLGSNDADTSSDVIEEP